MSRIDLDPNPLRYDDSVKASFPMVGFHRKLIEGAVETSESVMRAAIRAIQGETNELKEGVDPIQLLIEATRQAGRMDMLLALDDEAKA